MDPLPLPPCYFLSSYLFHVCFPSLLFSRLPPSVSFPKFFSFMSLPFFLPPFFLFLLLFFFYNTTVGNKVDINKLPKKNLSHSKSVVVHNLKNYYYFLLILSLLLCCLILYFVLFKYSNGQKPFPTLSFLLLWSPSFIIPYSLGIRSHLHVRGIPLT